MNLAQLLCSLFLTVVIMLPSDIQAEPVTASDTTGEYALLGGYGITHRGFGDTRTEVQTLDAILRYGRFLSDEAGKGSWFQGRHELLVELPIHLTVVPKTRIMSGFYLLGSWKFSGLAEKSLYPYVFAGGGPLYNDLGLASQGTRLNYSYQGGTGIQYVIRPGVSIIGEYRYHHVSNANTAIPNEPLNSSKILLGISRQF